MKNMPGSAKNADQKDVRFVIIVRCAIALERCSGFHCTWAFERRRDYFAEYPQGVMCLSVSCGGCPGRRLSRLLSNAIKCAKKKEGWNKENSVVHLAACIVNDNGHYPRCPFVEYMTAIILQKGLKLVEGGYESSTGRDRRKSGHYKNYHILHADKKEAFYRSGCVDEKC